MDFIAGGLVELIGGLASAVVLFGYAWWAPLAARRRVAGDALAAARERGLARPQHRRGARRAARRRLRLPPRRRSARRRRSCGCSGSPAGRSTASSPAARGCTSCSTRRPGCASSRCSGACCSSLGANVVVFWSLADAAADGRIDLGRLVVFAQAAVGTSMIAFGGLNWALDGAAAPVAAVLRLEPAMAPAGALSVRRRTPADGCPAREIRFRDVTFAYPGRRRAGARRLRPHDPGRLVARHRRPERRRQDHARQAAVPPVRPAVRRDRDRRRRPARPRSSTSWRARVTAVFQDFIRFELPLRDNVAPAGAPDDGDPRGARARPAPPTSPSLDTILAKGYDGGTDLSGGQWQRVALARALCAVRLGAGVVLLDEPTAQLDVRGEAEIFERILAATRQCTTILISHRFSTVRHADRICVLEHGRVDRARHARRADGARRPLPHDVRPAGPALRAGGRGRGGAVVSTSSPDAEQPAPTTTCRRRCRRCGGCASSATATSRG